YSTSLGGSGAGYDVVQAIAIGASGAGYAAYITGYTSSPDFPHCFAGNDCVSHAGAEDAFVTAFNPDGSIAYSRLLGGSGYDAGTAIAVGTTGAIYVTGHTTANFPTTVDALYPNRVGSSGSDYDGFVTRLTLASGIDYSTYLGGSGDDLPSGIAVDSSRNF